MRLAEGCVYLYWWSVSTGHTDWLPRQNVLSIFYKQMLLPVCNLTNTIFFSFLFFFSFLNAHSFYYMYMSVCDAWKNVFTMCDTNYIGSLQYMYSRYFWFTLDDKEISFTFYLFQYLGEDKGGRENREKVWIVINLNSFPVKHWWDSWGRGVKKQSKLNWNKSHFEFLDVCSSNVGCLRKNPPVQSSCTSFCWLTRHFCVWPPIL